MGDGGLAVCFGLADGFDLGAAGFAAGRKGGKAFFQRGAAGSGVLGTLFQRSDLAVSQLSILAAGHLFQPLGAERLCQLVLLGQKAVAALCNAAQLGGQLLDLRRQLCLLQGGGIGLGAAVVQRSLQGVHLLLCVLHGSFQLGSGGFQPLLLCLCTHPVVGGSDLLAGGGGQLCLQSICLLFTLVGLFLCGKAVFLQLGRLQAQLFHFLLAGEQTGAALHAAAGKAAACIDHLSVHGDHLVVVAVVPRHAGGLVDILHHDDAPQQVRDDILVPGVGLHQRRRQPRRTGKPSPERAGLHGIQRQKGGAACMVVAQQGDSGFRGGFVFHHDVLQRTAQRSLDGNLAPGLHLQDGGYRPQNAPQTACPGGAHDRTHRVLVAVHVLFQFPQHRKALPGGIQFPAQPLLGGIGFVQRGLAAAQLEFQTGADVAQLLFVFFQRLAVLYSIGQILFCLFQLCGSIPGALFQRGQTLPGGIAGGFGGSLCHLCFGALCGVVGKLCPQAVLAGTAGGAGICQPGKFGVQRFDLCRKLFARCLHGLCHGTVALQGGIRLGGILLPGGDLLL